MIVPLAAAGRAVPASPSRGPSRGDVEAHVPARDTARWVPVRDPDARKRAGPFPRPDRGPVELERRDDEEDARVGGAGRRAPEEDEEERDAERAGDVEAR